MPISSAFTTGGQHRCRCRKKRLMIELIAPAGDRGLDSKKTAGAKTPAGNTGAEKRGDP